jgi:cytochrome c
MIKLYFFLIVLIIFSACNDSKPKKALDAKKLIVSKCASCHNLEMPPVISDDELAPPMMAVAFHVKSFVTPSDESQRIYKAIEFVVDYVHYPSLEKSFCDKDSLKRYGLMPSQKDSVTEDEVEAIASYMFENFTQENLSKMQKLQAKYDSMPKGEKIALRYRCLGCHKVDKKIVGPSFRDISKKYINSKQDIKQSIRDGSKNRWKSSNGAIMPPFKKISKDELEVLSEWISNS